MPRILLCKLTVLELHDCVVQLCYNLYWIYQIPNLSGPHGQSICLHADVCLDSPSKLIQVPACVGLYIHGILKQLFEPCYIQTCN